MIAEHCAGGGFAPGQLVRFRLHDSRVGARGVAYEAAGQLGKILSFDIHAGRYLVETFDGSQHLAVENELLLFDLPPVGASGSSSVGGGPDSSTPVIHAVWPRAGAEDAARFTAQVTDALACQDYCVIQMFLCEESCSKAWSEAMSPLLNFKSMRRELEAAYLGHGRGCRSAWLEGLAEDKAQSSSALDDFDLLLSQFARFMVPVAPVALHFMIYNRTNGLVRVPLQSESETSRLRPYEVDDDDIAEGLLDEHVQFLKRRQLCMMLFCSSEGGELTLFPKDEARPTISMRTKQGQLVVFRHDRVAYSYRPDSLQDLVLQAWVLTEPDNFENLKLEAAGEGTSRDEAIGLLTGPHTPGGPRVDVLGISAMYAGGAESEDAAWTTFSSGADGLVRVPFSRFDMDLYSTPADSWVPGTSYTTHGGFVQVDIYAVDNAFFGIKEEEATLLAPAQRQCLERGYEALFRSGHRRRTLKGRTMGVFCGHSGDEFYLLQEVAMDLEISRLRYSSWQYSAITGRIAHIFGLKGPHSVIDTACSSALCAYSVGHSMLRRQSAEQSPTGIDSRMTEALMMGANMMPSPGTFANLCGPHMLSTKGRCFSFDASADGFARGEGVGAFVVRSQASRMEGTICTVIGSNLNQDGRSASMTAPNGPAQQECIRGSMKEAGLRASEITCADLHGTGTALGDPIEVGALKNVMQDRGTDPLMVSTSKTAFGHMEAGAGLGGLIKCMLMCNACSSPPNCHFALLNPHIDMEGFPAGITSEMSDWVSNSGYAGVSSFGYGGANARGDVFASASFGPHATGPVDVKKLDFVTVTCPFDEGPMHFLDGKAVPPIASEYNRLGPYRVEAIRDEFATYDYNSGLYKGAYQINPPDRDFEDAPLEPIFLVGTWDAFRRPHEMEARGLDGTTFTALVTLGETRFERFHFRVGKDPARSIYPVVPNGSQNTRVVGPAPQPAPVTEALTAFASDGGGGGGGLGCHHWLLDGRDDSQPAGTVFRITLQWGERLSVRWEPALSDEEPSPWCFGFRHMYSILGSWTSWRPEPMLFEPPAATGAGAGACAATWRARFRIGLAGTESFHFMRDEDDAQLIYPMRDRGGQGVPVCGPDEYCNGRSWTIRGKPGEVATATLRIDDGRAEIAVSLPSSGGIAGDEVLRLSAESLEGPCRHSYYIAGSFTGMQYEEMMPDAGFPGIFRYRGIIGPTGTDHFAIVMDGDKGLRLYPEAPGAYPGESIVRGPSRATDEQVFSIFALLPGAEFEIILDRRAADKRRVVDVRWLSERFDIRSLEATAFDFIQASPGLVR